MARWDDEPSITVVWLEYLVQRIFGDFDGKGFFFALDEGMGDGIDLLFTGRHVDGEHFEIAVIFGTFQGEAEPVLNFLGLADELGDASRERSIWGGEVFPGIDGAQGDIGMSSFDLNPKGEREPEFSVEIEQHSVAGKFGSIFWPYGLVDIGMDGLLLAFKNYGRLPDFSNIGFARLRRGTDPPPVCVRYGFEGEFEQGGDEAFLGGDLHPCSAREGIAFEDLPVRAIDFDHRPGSMAWGFCFDPIGPRGRPLFQFLRRDADLFENEGSRGQ